jgi:hypothetical protein
MATLADLVHEIYFSVHTDMVEEGDYPHGMRVRISEASDSSTRKITVTALGKDNFKIFNYLVHLDDLQLERIKE